MPKTIAITPSWYWPTGFARVTGVPPFRLDEILVDRWARRRPDEPAVVDEHGTLTSSELQAGIHEAAGALRDRAGDGRVVFCAGPSVEGTVLLLALMHSNVRFQCLDPSLPAGAVSGATLACADDIGATTAAATGLPVLRLSDLSGAASSGEESAPSTGLNDPVLALTADDDLVWHSNRSLLAGALSLGTFLGIGAGRPWLSTASLSTWEGIYGLTVPLAFGVTAVLAPPGESALDLMAREGVGASYWTLEDAFATTREAKRQVKAVRGVQDFMVLPTGRLFDPDQRRRVGKLFDTAALTMFGQAETGPIFVSHPSWYIDESVGIPLSNAWVVPVDPRSGNPIPTLWELVESAMVTVWSPSLFVGYEGDAHADRFRDGRFSTGLVASSDANGMIYLLPD